MTLIRRSLTASALVAAALSMQQVHAADSVDLTVTGSVIPASCTPAFGSGGVVDYGEIASGALKASDYNPLAVRQLTFSVACSAPAKMAIRTLSGRMGSTVSDSAEGASGFAPAPVALFGQAAGTVQAAGLGLTADAAKIGGFAARLAPGSTTADSAKVDQIVSADNGVSWRMDQSGGTVTLNDALTSWAPAGTTNPVAVTNLAGTMEIQAYLNKASALDLNKEIALDGLVTFEIVYL